MATGEAWSPFKGLKKPPLSLGCKAQLWLGKVGTACATSRKGRGGQFFPHCPSQGGHDIPFSCPSAPSDARERRTLTKSPASVPLACYALAARSRQGNALSGTAALDHIPSLRAGRGSQRGEGNPTPWSCIHVQKKKSQRVPPLHLSCPLHIRSEQAGPCFPPTTNCPPRFCSSWERLWPERWKKMSSVRSHHVNWCRFVFATAETAAGRGNPKLPPTSSLPPGPRSPQRVSCPSLDSAASHP